MGTFFRNQRNFTRFAWFTLAFLVLVVLWGAFVRATGSGAGCGSHWPLCNGVIIPRAARVETLIEFAHRISSGLSGLLVLGMWLWAFRLYPRGHVVRKGATLALVFIITESLLGAGLVLFEWVAYNASVARAISMALHLINTYLLLGAVTLTAWWATQTLAGRDTTLRLRGQGKVGWLVGGGLLLLLFLGVSGAVTALGDTLFPAGTLSEGISQDFLPTAHFLVRLRVYHPLVAIVTGIYLALASRAIAAERPGEATRRLARVLLVVVAVQLVAGFVNVRLLVPVWMQIIHLLLADVMWIAALLLSVTVLSQEAAVAPQWLPQVGD
ncbi:MAG TPA: COX15/CtaA family protein [Promineifilum sp.]|nr:COX15/CtaA family protein [Promineifilum sp.]